MTKRKGRRSGDHKNPGKIPSENEADTDNRSSDQSESQQINVSQTERQYSMIGGTVLVVCGLLRGSLSGLALAAIGGGFIYRGQTGHCHVYEALEFNTADDEQKISARPAQNRAGQGARKIHAPIEAVG